MDQQQQQTQCPTPPATTIAGTAITSQPTAAQSQPLPQQQQTQTPSPLSTSTPTTASSTPATNTLNPNPSINPSPSPKPSLTPPSRPTTLTPRPTSFSRPWQPQQHFSNFSSPSSSSSSSASSSTSVSPSIPAPPRGGIAIGVPAPRPSLSSPQPSPPFSSSFGQSFGSLGRSGVNAPDSVRSPGMHGLGVMGSLGSSSQMRPSGISVQNHQPRTVQQLSFRPPPSSSSSQSPATQNFQGPGHMRAPPVGSPLPNSSQSVQSFNQPWLSSASQAKPPLPPQSAFRPQMNSPSMQQRSHIPQQHSPLSTSSQQQHLSSVQSQQSKPSQQLAEHHGQQFSSTRAAQSSSQQHQISRSPGSAIQKSSSLSLVQPNAAQPYQNKIASAESDEFGNRILTKRSIHELVNQIDPSERLDPDVEEILVDIAEDFVESITTFGCSLAKHRKSDTLEAKDILVHLERNWNMTLPGFSGDEIKVYRKPLTNDIHKERLAAIKKSVSATEVSSARTNGGQTAVSAKGNLAKMPANSIGST